MKPEQFLALYLHPGDLVHIKLCSDVLRLRNLREYTFKVRFVGYHFGSFPAEAGSLDGINDFRVEFAFPPRIVKAIGVKVNVGDIFFCYVIKRAVPALSITQLINMNCYLRSNLFAEIKRDITDFFDKHHIRKIDFEALDCEIPFLRRYDRSVELFGFRRHTGGSVTVYDHNSIITPGARLGPGDIYMVDYRGRHVLSLCDLWTDEAIHIWENLQEYIVCPVEEGDFIVNSDGEAVRNPNITR